jgi:hypothetical protein
LQAQVSSSMSLHEHQPSLSEVVVFTPSGQLVGRLFGPTCTAKVLAAVWGATSVEPASSSAPSGPVSAGAYSLAWSFKSREDSTELPMPAVHPCFGLQCQALVVGRSCHWCVRKKVACGPACPGRNHFPLPPKSARRGCQDPRGEEDWPYLFRASSLHVAVALLHRGLQRIDGLGLAG